MPVVDPDFMTLPLAACTDAALARAQALGATHAEVRVESNRAHLLRLRDGRLEGSHDGMDSGLAVRVIVDGSWGFAASAELTPEAAADAAVRAVQLARVSRGLNSQPVELAAEPVQPDGVWVSSYEVDPFDVPDAEKIALLAEWSRGLLAADGVDHVDASVLRGQGAALLRRPRRDPHDPAAGAPGAGAHGGRRRPRHRVVRDACASLAPPVGRGWEYLTGDGWDWDAELAELPGHLAEKRRGARRSSRARTTWSSTLEPVAHHPRVDRPRHRARPGAGLRGQLRRHVVRDPRPARHAAVRLGR